MANREQNQTQKQPQRRDPVITPPDEEEIDVEDPAEEGEQRQVQQQDPRRQPESNVEQVEDEEAEEDEDEADGRGPNS